MMVTVKQALEAERRILERKRENEELKVEVGRLNAVLDEIYEFCYDIRLGSNDVDIEDVLGCFESLKPKAKEWDMSENNDFAIEMRSRKGNARTSMVSDTDEGAGQMNINERIATLVADKRGRDAHRINGVKADPATCPDCQDSAFIQTRKLFRTDLNAVAEARQVLLDTDEKRQAFGNTLARIISRRRGQMATNYDMAIATARDQCLAILEVLEGQK